MIELNDETDPMLFSVEIPSGKLVCQYMEIVSAMQGIIPTGTDPNQTHIVRAIRECTRTPEVAAAASDHVLTAAWARMTRAVQAAGNG